MSHDRPCCARTLVLHASDLVPRMSSVHTRFSFAFASGAKAACLRDSLRCTDTWFRVCSRCEDTLLLRLPGAQFPTDKHSGLAPVSSGAHTSFLRLSIFGAKALCFRGCRDAQKLVPRSFQVRKFLQVDALALYLSPPTHTPCRRICLWRTSPTGRHFIPRPFSVGRRFAFKTGLSGAPQFDPAKLRELIAPPSLYLPSKRCFMSHSP